MARELFARKAETLGKIGNHPQLPRLLDYFEQSQQFYFIQEYVSGNNLQQEVKQNGPFTEAGIRQFLSEILPMLEYLHSHQVIHRDIKPANITDGFDIFRSGNARVCPTRANGNAPRLC